MNHKFSIITHPIRDELMHAYEPGLKRLAPHVAKKILEWTQPFRVSKITGIKSYATSEELEGELIVCPLLMDQMVSLSSRATLKKVTRAVKLAKESHPSIIGLAAYTGIVGLRGSKEYEKIHASVTTGAHITLATAPEAILKAIKLLEYNPKKLKVLIFGANSLGCIILKTLGGVFNQFYLYHSLKDKVIDFYNSLSSAQRETIKVISRDPRYILKDIDVVINVSNNVPTGFDEGLLKSGAIVFDASYPRKINITREDVLLIDGVAMEPPGKPKFYFNFGLPEGYCFSDMAEAITLAFEKKPTLNHFNKEISIEKAESIYKLALKHGFKIGPLTSHEAIIAPEVIAKVIKNKKGSKKIFKFLKMKKK